MMKYQLYKFVFSTGVHFGSGSLSSTESTFCADTLFSALCQCALKMGKEKLDSLLSWGKDGSLCFSDAFPFLDEEYFLPKPMMHIELKTQNEEDPSERKLFKKLKYISTGYFEDYLQGKFKKSETEKLAGLGNSQMKTSAAVRGLEDAMPYRIQTFRFSKNGGLYIIFGYNEENRRRLFDELMEYLMMEGIGGKRSAGLGRFQCIPVRMDPVLRERLEMKSRRYMTLSLSIPQEQEMETALSGASYLLQKRSGFVASDCYADQWMRKRDVYLLAAGSCFSNTFRGCVLDVSDGGKHPVYRYAKPLFLGVDLCDEI